MPQNLPSSIASTSTLQSVGNTFLSNISSSVSSLDKKSAKPRSSSPFYFGDPIDPNATQTVDDEYQTNIRGPILTDEGSYRLNCSGTSFGIFVNSASFTSGSTIVTGSGFLSSVLRRGDYISTGSLPESTWYLVDSFSDSTIVLNTPWTDTTNSFPCFASSIMPNQGVGAILSMGGGSSSLNAGTSANSISEFERFADYLPLVKECEVAISQRIPNQDIYIGVYDEQGAPSNIKYFAWFRFNGSLNSQFICESCSVRSGSFSTLDVQSTLYSLNVKTEIYNKYRVECLQDEIRFIFNDSVVATHRRSILKPYDSLTSTIRVVNGSTPPTSNTSILINYDACYNYNKINVGFGDFDSKMFRQNTISESETALPITPRPQKVWRTSFAKNIIGGVDTDQFTLLKSGSLMTVSQSLGNLLLTTGIIPNSETVIRSNQYWSDAFILKCQSSLSQRIVNQNFFIEMVDVVGDYLPFNVISSQSLAVTMSNNPFDNTNFSQSMYVGIFSGSNTNACIPGRYAISQISGNNIFFNISGSAFSNTGSGVCSLFGWNYYKMLYSTATATNVAFDSQRKGYNSGDTTATINTTASPGHMGILYVEDGVVTYSDQLVSSATTSQPISRASRVVNIPGTDSQLYLQIRSLNGTTAPASNTTWTIGIVSIEEFASLPVSIHSSKFSGPNNAVNATITGSVTVSQPAAANLNATITGSVTVSQPAAANLNATVNMSQIAGQTVATIVPMGGTTTPLAPIVYFGSPTTNNVVEVTAAARTGSISVLALPSITSSVGGCLSAVLNVVSFTGSITTGGLDIQLQESYDNGVTWIDTYHFERVLTGSSTPIPSATVWMPPVPQSGRRRWTYVQPPNLTSSFTITTTTSNVNQPLYRQYFDRSPGVMSGSISSTTAAYNIAGCRCINATFVLSGSLTAGAIYQLQMSMDSASWIPLASATASLIPTTISSVNNVGKFARVQISTAASAQTGSYVCITGAN